MFWGIDNSEQATNETVYSVICWLATTMPALCLQLHQKNEVVTNQASDVLIYDPNPKMHGFEIINKMEVSRNESGDAYSIVERDILMQQESVIQLIIHTSAHSLIRMTITCVMKYVALVVLIS